MISKKILSFVFLLAIISLSFCCVEIVNASEEVHMSICKYTDEYVAWSKLSEEEKSKVPMPPICDLKATETNRLQSNVKKSFNVFKESILPDKFDIRDTNYSAMVRDQMDTGSCWAFSTAASLEIYAKKNISIKQIYSPRHIEYATSRTFLDGKINEWGFNREVGDGGGFFTIAGYLISQRGPVLEEDMPFENNEDQIYISEIQNLDVQLDVNGINKDGMLERAPCSSAAITNMKEKIHSKGAIMSNVNFSGSKEYYNPETFALYYNGEESSNHTITIVGWDDNYSANNFAPSNKPAGNGAWIVQNSWGEEFGDGGYNYVSYYDERICYEYMSVEDVDTEVEDNAYIYDKLGHNIALSFSSSSSSAYGMAVYNKEAKTEALKEVTIGTIDSGSYKIYYAPFDASSSSVAEMTLIGEGDVDYGGYLTHKLENPIYIDSDVTKFSIAVKWTVDDNAYPIPLCKTDKIQYIHLSVQKGQTYLSPDGNYWMDNYYDNYIASIKAFTDDVPYELSTQVHSVSKGDGDAVNVNLTFTARSIIKDDLKLIIKDSNDRVINDVTINYQLDSNNIPASAKLNFAKGLDNGKYYVNVYYQNDFIESIEFKVSFGLISDKYTISSTNKTIYISSPVIVSTFLSNIEGYDGGVTKAGIAVSSGYVGTGMMLNDYVIILKGDVTGDGQIKVNDVMKISKYTVEGTGLENSYFKMAADVTGDQLVKVNDVMKISKYTVEGGML